MRRLAVLVVLAVCGAWSCGQAVRTVGGTVSGLGDGKSLSLKMANQSLRVTKDGSFAFSVPVDEGTLYAVTVQTQPKFQVCSVANGSGVMGSVAISNVQVTCVDVNPNSQYPVQVEVTGLVGTLQLVNNNTDPLTVTANGVFAFPAQVAGGGAYSVTTRSQPSGQVCALSNATGTVSNAAVVVSVKCVVAYDVSGTVTYDAVPVKDQAGTQTPYLDYSNILTRPARRTLMQAIRSTDFVVLSETLTKDDGTYTLPVPQGTTVRIWARVESRTSGYVPDGIGQEHCNGASWDVTVVDNTDLDAAYVLQANSTFSAATTGANLHAVTSYASGAYTKRDGAPFALLDTAVSELELVCEGNAAYSLPLLYIGWSPKNVSEDGSSPSTGAIGTSYYTPDPNDPTLSRLYILGEQNVDTDEFDDHVVAHEFGHFVEYRLYRSDSVGGDHGPRDVLMPSVAFSEGYGNSVSGMVFNDPVYRDTNGVGQVGGLDIDVSEAPEGNDQGVYSETSVGYLLWSLYEARDGTPKSGSYDRLYTVLHDDQATTPALTSAVSFAAYYRARYGNSAEGLQNLWVNGLATPWDALCMGTCASNGGTDPFDTDNDVGSAYAVTTPDHAARNYPPASTTVQDANFWRLYEPLSHGTTHTSHDVIVGYGDSPMNKWGYVRAYVVAGTGSSISLMAQISGTQPSTCNNTPGNEMDAYLLQNGAAIAGDNSAGACPALSFSSQAATSYLWLILGMDQPVPSMTLVVQ